MIFKDRQEAGAKLAKVLAPMIKDKAVVYALPRGGVVLGYEIAKTLNCPLEALIIKKIGHPWQEEYAIGAVAESGRTLFNEEETRQLDKNWLAEATAKNLKLAQARRQLYSGDKPMLDCRDLTAIIVDDGIATGLTMELAIAEIKSRQPHQIIVAVPVLPADTARRLKKLINQLVYLEAPEFFAGAVGAYYVDFAQVDDKEVIKYLKKPK
jgi:putative phosphoribosyl transferase